MSGSKPVFTVVGGRASLGTRPCLVATPPEWQSAISRGTLWTKVWDDRNADVPVTDGSGVLLQRVAGGLDQIEIEGRDHRAVAQVGVIPDPGARGGIGFTASKGNYVAFVFHPSTQGDAASWIWQMYLWNRVTKEFKKIAHNPVDPKSGRPLQSAFVQPILGDADLFWLEAAPDTTGWDGGSQLVDYSLRDGTRRVLYRGFATVAGLYQNRVVLLALDRDTKLDPKKYSGDVPLRTYFLDPKTASLTNAPSAITAADDNTISITSNGDLLIWANNIEIRAWRPAWGQSITLMPLPTDDWQAARKAHIGPPTYVRSWGNFLAWGAGVAMVMDLTRNSIAELAINPGPDDKPGDAILAGSVLAIHYWTTPTSYNRKTNAGQYDEALIDLAKLPGLPGC